MPEANGKRKRVLLQRQSPDFCRTCRLRKVKCDGARPACRNCIRGDRVCHGYTTWSLALSVSQHDALKATTPLCAPVTLLYASDNLSRFSSVATCAAWEYYLQVGIHQQAKLHRTPERVYAALTYMLTHPHTFHSWYHPAAACGGVWQALVPVVHTTYSYPLVMVKYDVAMDLSARAFAAGTALSSSTTDQLVLLERHHVILRSSVNLSLAIGDLEGVRRHLRQLFVMMHTYPEWAAKAMAGSDYLAEIVQRPLYGLEMQSTDRDLTIGSGHGASLEEWMANLLHSCKRNSTFKRIPRNRSAFNSIQDVADFLHCLQDSVWKVEHGLQRASQRCVDDFLTRHPVFRRVLDVSKKQCLESCVTRLMPLDAALRKRIEDTLRGFQVWRDAFNELVGSGSFVSRCDLLLIQAFCAHFSLVACQTIEETGWDRHYQMFVQQIAVVTEYLKLGEYLTTTECGPPRRRPHYHSTFGEWGVLRALYIICTRCRDPNTRRKSVQLLAGARWDEGTLSSAVLAKYAEAIIGAEEGRAGGISEEALVFTGIFANSIPERARFSDVVAWDNGQEGDSFQLVCGRIVREKGGYIELSNYNCSSNPVRACESGVVEIPWSGASDWSGSDVGARDNGLFTAKVVRGL